MPLLPPASAPPHAVANTRVDSSTGTRLIVGSPHDVGRNGSTIDSWCSVRLIRASWQAWSAAGPRSVDLTMPTNARRRPGGLRTVRIFVHQAGLRRNGNNALDGLESDPSWMSSSCLLSRRGSPTFVNTVDRQGLPHHGRSLFRRHRSGCLPDASFR